MNSNPFYVHPAGDYSQQLQGIAGLMAGITELKRKEQQDKEKARLYAEMKTGAISALKSGDPNVISDFMISNPEMSQAVNNVWKMRSGLDEAAAEKEKQEYFNAAVNLYQNPSEEAIQAYIDEKSDLKIPGADSALERYRANPESFMRSVGMEIASIDPEKFKAMMEAQGTGLKPTANIQDWEYLQKLKETNPGQAEQFARQIGVSGADGEPTVKPTAAQQNFLTWQRLPDGPEKRAFGEIIGIDFDLSPSEQRKQIEYSDKIRGEIDNADETMSLVNKILDNDGYVNSLTGKRGAIPFSVPGGTGWDANVVFDQLKNSLTLDNLNKMSGVLSDSDIKILRSAGAGIDKGMSKPAFKERLNKIKNVLTRKTARYREKLKAYPVIMTQDQYDRLPQGAIYVEDGVEYRKP